MERKMPSRLYWFLALIILATIPLFTLSSCNQNNATGLPLDVLFIGNSYTATNSLPTILQEIAVNAGYARPVVESVAPGGYTFEEHLNSSATRSMISDQHWDVVVMQEQSETPSAAQTMPGVKDLFLGGFDGLYNLVAASNPQARVTLFETWARSADCWTSGTANPAWDGENPFDMLQRLKAGYEQAAQSVAAQGGPPVEIARVGELWDINYRSQNPIELYASDGSHPDFAGSYLAALDIFSTIYGQVPKTLKYRGTLGKDEAAVLLDLVSRNFPEIQEPE
jgi:hypothetical protein